MTTLLTNKENTAFRDTQTNQSDQLKKVKNQLNDALFELKKVQEDNASQKALLTIQFNKEKRKADQTIQELKVKITHENQYWTQKVDSLRDELTLLTQKSNHEFTQKTKQMQSYLKNSIGCAFDDTIRNLEAKISSQGAIYQQKIKSQQKQYNQKINMLYNVITQKDSQIQLYAVRKVQEKSKQYEAIIESYKKTKSQQQSTIKMYKIDNKALKQELNLKETKYQQEIKKITKQNQTLKQKNENLSAQIQGLKQKCDSAQKRKDNEVSQIKVQLENNLQQKKWLMDQQIEAVKKQCKQYNEKLQGTMKKIIAATLQKQRLLDQRSKAILQQYENRLSKEQDIKTIEHLQMKLMKKEMDLQKQKQQVKTCKMEIQNLEQFYGKLFESQGNKNQKASSFKSRKIKVPPLNRSKNNTKDLIEQSF